MPSRHPPYQTCNRWFQEWVRSGTFEAMLRKLVQDVKKRGELALTECFIDGAFFMAKKEVKGIKLMAVAEGTGFPVALSVGSASQHEVCLVEETLEKRLVPERRERLISDRAYDRNPLNEILAKQGVTLIAPHKYNRKKPTKI